MTEMISKNLELLIVGAGPVGCVVAQQAASRGFKVVVVEKRKHIAGNCYDETHSTGFQVHRYGPHYFRTNSEKVYDYLSRFTAWKPGTYRAQSLSDEKLYPFPLNLDSLELFFGRTFDESTARKFIEAQTIAIPNPSNAEDYLLSTVGPRLYEAFFKAYTEKQWGRPATELAPSVVARVPINFDRNPSYVRAKYEVLPENGYTSLFAKMLSNQNIELNLNEDFFAVRERYRPTFATLYTGPLDRYFDFQFGQLPWRSLRFEFETHQGRNVQPVGQINFPDSRPYTRTVEFSHISQCFGSETVVSTEYPSEDGDPYYPVPSAASALQFEKYRALANLETKSRKVFFEGRLANYTYINIDQAIALGLDASAKIFGDDRVL